MNSIKSYRRNPLPPSAGSDDVTNVAAALGLHMNNFIGADGSTPREAIYNVPGTKTFLHHVDDHLLGLQYVTFTGDDVVGLEQRVRALLPLLTAEDVKRMFDEAVDEERLERALGAAFILAGTNSTPEFRNYFDAAFEHESAEIRRYGILGVGYTGWGELAAPLRHLATNDPEGHVRQAAERMLRALEQQQQGGKD
jgi:hypothetical protein